jgi:hypothetical protein
MSEAPLSDAGPVNGAPEGSAGPPCRGRTTFPWLGMMLSGVTVTGDAGGVTVPAGALVTVIRKMKDGLYVQVRGTGSGPLRTAISPPSLAPADRRRSSPLQNRPASYQFGRRVGSRAMAW